MSTLESLPKGCHKLWVARHTAKRKERSPGKAIHYMTRRGGKQCPLLIYTSVVMFNGLRK